MTVASRTVEDTFVNFPIWLYKRDGQRNGYNKYGIKKEVEELDIIPDEWPRLISVKSFNLPKGYGDREHVWKDLKFKYVLSHPGLLTCYGLCEEGLVTEIVPPRLYATLESERNRGGRLTEQQIAILAVQMLAALEYLHDNAVVHGKLSPDNVFLACNERLPKKICLQVKLADFGMEWSRLTEEEDEYSNDGWSDWSSEADIKAAGDIIEMISKNLLARPSATSNLLKSFLAAQLEKDPRKRLSATELLGHPFIIKHTGPGKTTEIVYDKDRVFQQIEHDKGPYGDALLMAAFTIVSDRKMKQFKHDTLGPDNSLKSQMLAIVRNLFGRKEGKVRISKTISDSNMTISPPSLEVETSMQIDRLGNS